MSREPETLHQMHLAPGYFDGCPTDCSAIEKGSCKREPRDMTGNVQLYLTGDSLVGAWPRMGAHLVGFGWGVKGVEFLSRNLVKRTELH